MRVIPPMKDVTQASPFSITAAMLTSSTAAEPGVGEVAYSSGTTYLAGQRAILGAPSSTVTITIAAPGVISWTANGLPNGAPVVLTTTGALPTGLSAATIYYVVNRATNSLQLSATPNGLPITTTGSQSGTHTATAALHRIFESLSGTQSTVTITLATPGVISWTAHGLEAGAKVVLATTGALPTGLTAATTYYVVNPAEDTFQLAATQGGTAINTSGSQSGTHTATANGNTNHSPAIDDGTWWEDVGPTNAWACFDLLSGAQTWAASPLVIVLAPGQRFDAIGINDLVADSVTFSLNSASGGGVVYTASDSLSTRFVANWYDHFFSEFTYRAVSQDFDIPPYSDGALTITMARSSGLVGCGAILPGMQVYVGTTIHDGANGDVKNYSEVERNFAGRVVSMTPRRSVPLTSLQVRVEQANVNRVRALRDRGDAVPMFWSGIDDTSSGYFELVQALAFYTRFSIAPDHAEVALASIELEKV